MLLIHLGTLQASDSSSELLSGIEPAKNQDIAQVKQNLELA